MTSGKSLTTAYNQKSRIFTISSLTRLTESGKRTRYRNLGKLVCFEKPIVSGLTINLEKYYLVLNEPKFLGYIGNV